jgi:hypothetical protein
MNLVTVTTADMQPADELELSLMTQDDLEAYAAACVNRWGTNLMVTDYAREVVKIRKYCEHRVIEPLTDILDLRECRACRLLEHQILD